MNRRKALLAGVPATVLVVAAALDLVRPSRRLLSPPAPRPPTAPAAPPIIDGALVAYSLKEAERRIRQSGRDGAGADALTLGGIAHLAGLVCEADEVIVVGRVDQAAPALGLDDLAVAMRALFVAQTWPLVSIDPTADTPTTGRQAVRLEGGIAGTAFGRDLLAADVKLKELALNLTPSGVPAVTSYVSEVVAAAKRDPHPDQLAATSTRFWFRPRNVSLAVRDGVAVIREAGIGVLTETIGAGLGDGAPPADPPTPTRDQVGEAFAAALTEHYSDLRAQHRELERLKGLFDLVALARGLQLLPSQPGLRYWLDEYEVPPIEVPADYPVLRQEETLPLDDRRLVLEVAGGIEVQALVARLQDGDVSALREAVLQARPSSGQPLVWQLPFDRWAADDQAPAAAAATSTAASGAAGAGPLPAGMSLSATVRPEGSAPSPIAVPLGPPPPDPSKDRSTLFLPPPGGDGGVAGGIHGVAVGSDPGGPGGVDFRSVRLTYLSEAGQGRARTLGYVLRVDVSGPRGSGAAAGPASRLASDAFFVQLAIDPSRLWVNLQPTMGQPSQIIDPVLAGTDVGRIYLLADYELKRTVASLLRDDTPTGKAFWDAIDAYAEAHGDERVGFAIRQWITCGEVLIYADADAVYVLRASMDVQLEGQQPAAVGGGNGVAGPYSAEMLAYAEELYRRLLLPEVTRRVNSPSASEYRQIQTVFASRVVAEWYRLRYQRGGGLYSPLIGRDDLAAWPATVAWDPMDVWRDYARSYQEGEIRVTREKRTTQGNRTLTRTSTFVFGGIDFHDVQFTMVPYADLLAQRPAAPRELADALITGVGGEGDPATRWWGGLHVTAPAAPSAGRMATA